MSTTTYMLGCNTNSCTAVHFQEHSTYIQYTHLRPRASIVRFHPAAAHISWCCQSSSSCPDKIPDVSGSDLLYMISSLCLNTPNMHPWRENLRIAKNKQIQNKESSKQKHSPPIWKRVKLESCLQSLICGP